MPAAAGESSSRRHAGPGLPPGIQIYRPDPELRMNAEEAQRQMFRDLGPEGRVRVAFEMSDEAREIVADGVRSRHPDYDESRVRLAVLRLSLGDALFAKAFPGTDVLP